MTNNWERWEGRDVGGEYVLENCVGSSEHSAVFRARRSSGEPAEVAIKLATLPGADAEKQLGRWQAASELQHPNLIRLFDSGRETEDGREFVYVVEEYAEENLGQILPERALSADEARGMLGPILAALEYTHGFGFVEGSIHPGNILASGDQVKLSSDGLQRSGDALRTANVYAAPELTTKGASKAGDIWSLGMTLAAVLTQRMPEQARGFENAGAALPEPFRGIIERCLEKDAARRCGIAEIRERLEKGQASLVERETRVASPSSQAAPTVQSGPIAASEGGRKSGAWRYWLGAAVVAIAGFVVLHSRSTESPAGSASVEETKAVESKVEEKGPQSSVHQDLEKRAKPAKTADEVVDRVMPEVSPSARHTITGKIKVRVRVKADGEGKVTEAKLTSAGPSKYFAHAALEAARQWKFAPSGEESRTWNLVFGFTRARTETSATRAR